MPELVFLLRRTESKAQLHQRVAGPEDWMYLYGRGRVLPKAAESDPAGNDVTLDGNEAEGSIIGVNDHQPRCQHETTRKSQIENRPGAGGNSSRAGGEKVVSRRPEIGEFRPPYGYYLLRLKACVLNT